MLPDAHMIRTGFKRGTSMIPSFPRWVWAWAALLPAVAGSTNAVALLTLRHSGVTHLTGMSTEAGIGIGAGDMGLLLHAAAIIGLFTFGCTLSSALARGPRWIPSASIATLIFTVAILLVIASRVIKPAPASGLMVCALALGVQNGTTSLTTGAVLRTSHLTGMFTDIGIALGQRTWAGPVDSRRVAVCALVISSFVLGAVVGAVMYERWEGNALLGSAALAAVVAVLSAGLCLRRRLSES